MKKYQGDPVDQSVFRTFVGKVLFAQQKNVPVISNAVRALTTHLTSPGPEQWTAMDHLMGYLKFNPQDRKTRPPRILRGEHFSDSDMAGDPNDRVSVTGFVSTIGGSLGNYRSKKQAAFALSSSEIEIPSYIDNKCITLW